MNPHNGTETSISAARAAGPSTSQQEQRVLHVLALARDGLTRHEIARDANLGLASVCARVNALIREKVLFEDGSKRKSPFGRDAKVVNVVKSVTRENV